MKKSKIAISIDNSLLSVIDSYVDKMKIRSRSQAIEFLLKNSIKEQPVDTAVLLVNPEKFNLLSENYEGFSLIQHHLNFLLQNNFKNLIIVTKRNKLLEDFSNSVTKLNIDIVNQDEPEGTAAALQLVKEKLNKNFLLVNGDTLNEFDLKKMILTHLENTQLVTMGLISSEKPENFGSVILEGNSVIEFNEKKNTFSNVINAGIYLVRPNVFEFYDDNVKSLEFDLFPKLAKMNKIYGFFTYGKYIHFSK